jgi:plastocyanin
MPGTGTKPKKTAASAAAAAGSAPIPITVSGGNPDPDTVTVSVGTRIQFTNYDSVGYLIQMSSNGAATPPVDVVLPALSTVSVVASATNQKQTATYQLTAIAQSNTGAHTDTGGGGRIIINP